MSVKQFFEKMYFNPEWYHYLLMVLLFPFSIVYGVWMFVRRLMTVKQQYSIPIISIGNLQVGGSGKTPFVIALASRYEGVCIVSRGYGRRSIGLVEVSYRGKILVDVSRSGDEAMLMAQSLPHASVIVSEDRALAIDVAMREGAKVILFDDGFNRVDIAKYEILLEPSCMPNILPFPAGGLREFYGTQRLADMVLTEGEDFERDVEMHNLTQRMVLVTAISNPARLKDFLPEGVVAEVYYDDHAFFDDKILQELLDVHQADSILCTSKDRVKMHGFKLPISEMKLELVIDKKIVLSIDNYVNTFSKE